jgi:hypothetical protein
MSGFSIHQLKKLSSKLDRARVQSKIVDGRSLDYIEGWFAMSEANVIFGYAGWDRELAFFERLFERRHGEMISCGYVARVRLRVHAGERSVIREGTGFGHAQALSLADAHERALKTAETDATKRALATFGNRFGLGLYDREQAGVSEKRYGVFDVICPNGEVFAAGLSAEGFCGALRKILATSTNQAEIDHWWHRNAPQIRRLRASAPELKTARGEHYADVLKRLFRSRPTSTDGTPSESRHDNKVFEPLGSPEKVARSSKQPDKEGPEGTDLAALDGLDVPAAPSAEMSAAAKSSTSTDITSACRHSFVRAPAGASIRSDDFCAAVDTLPHRHVTGVSRNQQLTDHQLAPSRIAYGARIDKAVLAIGSTRRRRDKDHLRYVATLSCLICQKGPSHAHHIRYAQPHGMSQKVSDEFVVPLCAEHHNELHRKGSERAWWQHHGLEPLTIAAELWSERHASNNGIPSDA